MKNAAFRIRSYVAHYLTSRHTLGYGIHSPYLFYIARAIFPEDSPYYCFADVEALRKKLSLSSETIHVEDFGTGHSGPRAVSAVLNGSVKSRREAQLLFRLVNFCGARTIVELGTCLGLTTAYLALPYSDSMVYTFEGSGELAKMARHNWQSLGISNIRLFQGDISQTLSARLSEIPTVDFAFLDANHTSEATLRYFETLLPKVHEKTIFVLDDIRYNKDMFGAWKQITKHPAVTATMDLGDMGLVFFDSHYLRETYRIRF